MFKRFRSIVRNRWQDMLDGFYVVPGIVTFIGPLLAAILLLLDRATGNETVLFLFGGNPGAARSVLSTIASSLIAVAGLVFSITIVTLQLVSSQFTPRALRGLLSDRITQVCAGGVVGIFVYCQVVLVAIRDPYAGHPQGFIPVVSTSVAVILAFVGVVLLGVFISHTSSSIQVSNIASRVAHQTLSTLVDRPYPGWQGERHDDNGRALVDGWRAEADAFRVYSSSMGYIQTIGVHDLTNLVTRYGLRLHLKVCPGDFVTRETLIAEVWPADAVDDGGVIGIQESISLARERDLEQDALFGVRQLADICLRALSPAINDPTTGVLCIGYLQAIMERIAALPVPTSVYHFQQGDAYIVTRFHTFEEYMEVVTEIGRYATSNARVVGALLDAIKGIGTTASSHKRSEHLKLLLHIAQAVSEPAIREARTELDRVWLRQQLQHVEKLLQVP